MDNIQIRFTPVQVKTNNDLSHVKIHLFYKLVRVCSVFLRTIKQKRNEGYNIVYLNETWVDTHHTASYQWTPPNPSDA
jgi:hypothetical protein